MGQKCSTPCKNRRSLETDIRSTVADLSFVTDQSLIASLPDTPTSEAHDIAFDDHFTDADDILAEIPSDDADVTRATLGESIDIDCLDDDTLNISVPDVDDEDMPGLDIEGESISHIASQKCIAFIDPVLDLVRSSVGDVCRVCQTPFSFTHQMSGTALVIRWKCHRGHKRHWSSQPKVKGLFAGNLQLATDILLTGNSYAKIAILFSYVNLGCVAQSSFYNVQRFYALPAIEKFWMTMQTDILS